LEVARHNQVKFVPAKFTGHTLKHLGEKTLSVFLLDALLVSLFLSRGLLFRGEAD